MPTIMYETPALKAKVDRAGDHLPFATTHFIAMSQEREAKKPPALRRLVFAWIALLAGVSLSVYLPWWTVRIIAR